MSTNNAINNTLPSPFTLGATSVTSTGTQLNYLSGLSSVPINKIVVQTFVADGKYTPTSGMVYCTVEIVGGGGGGGGVDGQGAGTAGGGAGGSAGGYARKTFTAATIGSSQTVSIGALGAGGTSGNNPGTGGGTTTFGALLTATGGGGGAGALATTATWTFSIPTAAGAGSSGDFNTTGGTGQPGQWGAAQLRGQGGSGGSSFYGGGALSSFASSTAVTGNNATSYGGGGSGASVAVTANNAAGGDGVAGICVVTEYVSA